MNEACIQTRPCVDTTWVWTGEEKCDGAFIVREMKSNCGNTRWDIVGDVIWTDTGETRCNAHVTELEQVNQCGTTRWNPTGEKCGYNPSVPIVESCDGCSEVGYLFHPNEDIDPEATVLIASCTGDSGYAYPTAGTGHTVKIQGCGGDVAYAANKSSSAPALKGCC